MKNITILNKFIATIVLMSTMCISAQVDQPIDFPEEEIEAFSCFNKISVTNNIVRLNRNAHTYVYTISGFCKSSPSPVSIIDLDDCLDENASGLIALFDEDADNHKIGASIAYRTESRQVGHHTYRDYYIATITLHIPQNTNAPNRKYEILSYAGNQLGLSNKLPVSRFVIEQEGDSDYQFYYSDIDQDGFGDCNEEKISSKVPIAGKVTNNIDKCPNEPGKFDGCSDSQSDKNLNWIKSESYDITGRLIASGKNYFDDLGKLTQSQSYDIKYNRMWASQIMYDTQGRPALQTLSAPTVAKGTGVGFIYNQGFIKNKQGQVYKESDFEDNPENPKTINPEEFTLGHYYSTENRDEILQDITDYPFSRTIYSELNPGAALKTIGGNKQDSEWKQGYTFSMPAGDALTRSGAFNNASYKVSNTRKIIKTISRDVDGVEVVAFTDTDGKSLAAARTGLGSPRNTIITMGTQGYVDVHVPVGITGFTIKGQPGVITEVYNLITEQVTTAATSSLDNGFYRVAITNLESYNPNNPITITCKENYYDYSLNEYDEVGRLTASYQPLNKLKTEYQYNGLSQLTYTKSPDEGEAWFKYRKDGQIRFSQNSKQKAISEFSYTNYDALGRPIESGVASGNFNSLDPDTSTVSSSKPEEKQETTYDALSQTDLNLLSSLTGNYANPSFLASNVAKTKNINTTTYYSYDVYGRVKWVVQDILGLDTKTIDYNYDQITGAVTKVDYQKNNNTERFVHRYTYDITDNSLTKVETSTNGVNFTIHANYKYYETGALKRVELAPDTNGNPLQGLDYVYNLNGQLKAINHPSLSASKDPGGDANDLFGMMIDYHSDDFKRPLPNIETTNFGVNQYNGNIKGIRWNNSSHHAGTNKEAAYAYHYDKNNWLTDAHFGTYGTPTATGAVDKNLESVAITNSGATLNISATKSITLKPNFHAKAGSMFTAKIVDVDGFKSNNGDYDVTGITYDANGNIQSLKRNKNTQNGSNAMDNLSYTYKTNKPNQLLQVTDAAGNVAGADDIGSQNVNNYQYNSIGQLIKNNEDGIEYIYNTSGLVTQIHKNSLPLVNFFYNDKGHRVKKEIYTGSALTRTDFYIRDASGTTMAIYEKLPTANAVAKEYTIYGASRLGVFKRADRSSLYQITDHLGNVRAVTGRASNGTPMAVVASTDYYPGGMAMPNRNIVGDYRYNYQGQELDKETGKVAFELRLYDPRINRWLTTDPKGEFSSPYLAMGNNWINKIDPDGGSTAEPLDRYKLGADGSITYYDNKGGDTVDYLFTEGDLSNEIRVTDTSILPQLEGNSIFQKSFHSPDKFLEGSYAISGNHNQVKRLYDWIGARNSNEWTYVKASTDFGNKSFIGTLRTNDQGLNPSSGRGGFGNFSIIEHSHTHFGTALYDFQPSGPDMNYASTIRKTSPNAKFSIYSPLITKGLYNEAIKGKYRTFGVPYKPINYEPSRFIKY